jgi:hypothetical protein
MIGSYQRFKEEGDFTYWIKIPKCKGLKSLTLGAGNLKTCTAFPNFPMGLTKKYFWNEKYFFFKS